MGGREPPYRSSEARHQCQRAPASASHGSVAPTALAPTAAMTWRIFATTQPLPDTPLTAAMRNTHSPAPISASRFLRKSMIFTQLLYSAPASSGFALYALQALRRASASACLDSAHQLILRYMFCKPGIAKSTFPPAENLIANSRNRSAPLG